MRKGQCKLACKCVWKLKTMGGCGQESPRESESYFWLYECVYVSSNVTSNFSGAIASRGLYFKLPTPGKTWIQAAVAQQFFPFINLLSQRHTQALPMAELRPVVDPFCSFWVILT